MPTQTDLELARLETSAWRSEALRSREERARALAEKAACWNYGEAVKHWWQNYKETHDLT